MVMKAGGYQSGRGWQKSEDKVALLCGTLLTFAAARGIEWGKSSTEK